MIVISIITLEFVLRHMYIYTSLGAVLGSFTVGLSPQGSMWMLRFVMIRAGSSKKIVLCPQ